MTVYVESNFILELAREQEDHGVCEQILIACETGTPRMVLPAFSIAEPYETVVRDAAARAGLNRDLGVQLAQIERSQPYREETRALTPLTGLLSRIGVEELQRLDAVVGRIVTTAQTIPVGLTVVQRAADIRKVLPPKDAIVCASVLHHLDQPERDDQSCFIVRDKHFDELDIRDQLRERGCKLFTDFANGYEFVQSQLP